MNKRERMMTVLSGKQADRVPASFWHHFGGSAAEGDACVQAHMEYYEKTGVDFIKIMSDGLSYPIDVTIDCAADWKKVKPLPKDHPFFTESVKRCKAINKALNGEAVTFYNLFSPFNVVRERDCFTERALQKRSWDATVMAQLRESEEAEDAIRHAMMVIGEDMAYLAKAVIVEGGCLGIYQSVQGAEKGRMSQEEYQRIVRVTETGIIDAANSVSKYNILHMCSWAGNPNHLSYWKDYPTAVKNWGIGIEGLSLTEAKDFFPAGTIMLGGLDNRKTHPLYAGTEEEIRKAVDDVLAEMKDTPFIMGADCTIPPDTNLDHVRWVMDELEKNKF